MKILQIRIHSHHQSLLPPGQVILTHLQQRRWSHTLIATIRWKSTLTLIISFQYSSSHPQKAMNKTHFWAIKLNQEKISFFLILVNLSWQLRQAKLRSACCVVLDTFALPGTHILWPRGAEYRLLVLVFCLTSFIYLIIDTVLYAGAGRHGKSDKEKKKTEEKREQKKEGRGGCKTQVTRRQLLHLHLSERQKNKCRNKLALLLVMKCI